MRYALTTLETRKAEIFLRKYVEYSSSRKCIIKEAPYPPGWVLRGSRLLQDDLTLFEGEGGALGGEAAVRPAEETSVPDWPVEDGLRQCTWLVQGRVALSLLARKETRIRVMLADGRDKISIAKATMILFREHSKRTKNKKLV